MRRNAGHDAKKDYPAQKRRTAATETSRFSQRPASPARPRSRAPTPPGQRRRSGPPLTRGRGTRACRASPDRLDSPPQARPPHRAPPQRATPRGKAHGGRGTTTPARPRAPERRPGALQEQPEDQSETHSRAQAEARGASAGRPSPPRGGAARGTQPGKAGGECPLRHKDHAPHRRPEGQGGGKSEVGPGSAPLSFPHTASQAGKERRGARGRSEKSGPIHQECPSLVRRGLGPARESATSPHRSENTHGGGPEKPPHRAAGRGGKTRRGLRERGLRFSLTRFRKPSPRRQPCLLGARGERRPPG